MPRGITSSARSDVSLASSIVPYNDANLNDPNSTNIKVVIRVRPLNETETQRKDEKAIHCMEDSQTIRYSGGDGKNKPLTFNRVLAEESTQEQVFETCGVKDLLERALDGYAVTVFAFGQTGSGKTFTITGSETSSTAESQGIIPRSLNYLFDKIVSRPENRYTLRAAYLEIYNEQVQDLLNPSNTSLPVRWTSEKGFYVENLFVVECEVLDDCFAVLEEGLRNRTVAAHALNEHSSRSHSIMTLQIDSEVTDPQDGRVSVRQGKIHFVDLAGSEKVKESKVQGENFSEALNINKSLLTLGQCISALSDPKRKGAHVPFRDSKLTKLLADSLGGRGLSLMIACVSPSSYNINESMKTLRYAENAKRIKNKPIIQMDPREEYILQLKTEIKGLRQENQQLKQRIGGNFDGASDWSLMRGLPALSNAGSALITRNNSIGSNLNSPTATLHLDHNQTKSYLSDVLGENENLKFEMQELLESKRQSDLRYGAALRDNESLAIQLTECSRVIQEMFGSDEVMNTIRQRALLIQASNSPPPPAVLNRMRGAGKPEMSSSVPLAMNSSKAGQVQATSAPPAPTGYSSPSPAANGIPTGLPRRKPHSVVPNKQAALATPSNLRPNMLSLPPNVAASAKTPTIQGVVDVKAQLIQDLQSIDAAIQQHKAVKHG